VRAAWYIVAAVVATARQVRAEPDAANSAFAELHADWIHPVHGFAGVGEGFSSAARVGFFPTPSVRLAVAAQAELSCAQHLSCWKGGMIGARYERGLAPSLTLSIDGLVGLETVGLHVGKELYGYVGVAELGLRYRVSFFHIGPQLGTRYSSVPSYNADIGPDPSGLMITVGVTAEMRW
jgi:hypothetical protein